MKSTLTKSQFKVDQKVFKENGITYRLNIRLRYDDEYGNGHNTFAITADLYEKKRNGVFKWCSGGCLHDEIIKHAPEYAHLIKWHLMSSDEPLHYVANTLYHASSRDCWGKLKGEPYNFKKSIKFKSFPVCFEFKQDFINWVVKQKQGTFSVLPIEHKKDGSYDFSPKYTFAGFACEWHECPFDNKEEAEQFAQAFNTIEFETPEKPTSWGEGKDPDLQAARACALWPDATLEQLQDKDLLMSRLPQLQADFKKAMEEIGFVF